MNGVGGAVVIFWGCWRKLNQNKFCQEKEKNIFLKKEQYDLQIQSKSYTKVNTKLN